MMSRVLLLTFLALTLPPSYAMTCQERYLSTQTSSSICADWQTAPVLLNRYSDGSVVYNPRTITEGQVSPQILSTVTSNRALFDGLRSYVSAIKAAMVAQIQAQTETSGPNAHQRFLLERLASMRVTYNYEDGCVDFPYNASYAAAINTLNICPLVSRMPKESALALVAHELGHLADPCNYIDEYKFSDSLRALQGSPSAQERRLRADIQSCLNDASSTEVSALQAWATAPTRMAAQALTLFPYETEARKALVRRLTDCGVVTAPQLLAPTRYEGTPYLSMISCVSARYPTGSQVTPVNGASLIGTGAVCNSRNPQVKETVADYIGVSLVNYAINHGLTVAEDRSGLTGLFYSSVHCDEQDRPSDSYATSGARMRIFLQTPILQQLMGCDGEQLPQECAIPPQLLR